MVALFLVGGKIHQELMCNIHHRYFQTWVFVYLLSIRIPIELPRSGEELVTSKYREHMLHVHALRQSRIIMYITALILSDNSVLVLGS